VAQFEKNDSYQGIAFSDAAEVSEGLSGFSRWL
jgi:hypothetical protein